MKTREHGIDSREPNRTARGTGQLLRSGLWLRFDVNFLRSLVEVFEKCRAQPTFHFIFGREIPVAAILLPLPFQFRCVARERGFREQQPKTLLSVGNLS